MSGMASSDPVNASGKIGDVPNQSPNRPRGVRLEPELWAKVVAEAEEREMKASAVMREAIIEHLERREAEGDE